MDNGVMKHLKTRLDDKGWECEFCGHPFPWSVSRKTITSHLTGVQGSTSRIRVCDRVPEDVKEAAAAVQVEQTRPRRTRGELINELAVQTREVEAAESSRVEGNWEPTIILDEHENRVSNFEAEVSSSNKRQRTVPYALPIEAAEVEVPMMGGIPDTGESASLTKRLVGGAFEINVERIRSWLMDDQVLRVGIHGMGGVGKTTLMRHIRTLLKEQGSFKVYWITVSQDFSIYKLQNLIAKKIALNFSDEEDEVERAEKLTQALKAEGKCVLVLDDLWNYFDAADVGIPVGVNSCKLVLTTRLLDVCRQMHCSEGNTIQVQALSKEEAWILFTQELGTYNTGVEELAKSVCRECAGLPLGIRVMARTMRGVCTVHTWRSTLVELKESKVRKGHEIRGEVFSVLKFSYLRLNDPALQECLLYCALFPEDYNFFRDDLIEFMIVEGIIDEKKSRQAEYDKGHTMLDALKNACLLEGDTKVVWMHDLIRDMAVHELREGSNTLVEAGGQLKKLPDVDKWTENLVRVSLMVNDIEAIPSGHTPRCPNLSTLLLCKNRKLREIADSFFEQFQKLKILDFSYCCEIRELPGAVSNLVNLTALLLGECGSLIGVPSLAKLEKLKKLDLHGCSGLREMPEGVEFLLSLEYLDISDNGIKEIGSGIIPVLSRLQFLKLCDIVGRSKISVRVREVGELRMLENLYCKFSNLKEFGEYLESRERSQQLLSHYRIFIVGGAYKNAKTGKHVNIQYCSFNDPLTLPADIETLYIERCDCGFYKRLFPPNLLPSLINLREIVVYETDGMEEIFAMDEGDTKEQENRRGSINSTALSAFSTHSLSSHSLLNLKKIEIVFCDELKKLFPPSLLPNLHNLKKIRVSECCKIEEMFSTDQGDGKELLFGQSINNNHYPPNLVSASTVSIGLNLPKLTRLELEDLPELRSIYNGAITCHSLQQIRLVLCPKLERITLPLPLPSLQTIDVCSKKWWESVQWGSAYDKVHLQSLVEFHINELSDPSSEESGFESFEEGSDGEPFEETSG